MRDSVLHSEIGRTSLECLHMDHRDENVSLEDWMKSPQNVYIGPESMVLLKENCFGTVKSNWHNPFLVNHEIPSEETFNLYKDYLKRNLASNTIMLADFLSLKGKTLGCFCSSKYCHGHVLIGLLNEY